MGFKIGNTFGSKSAGPNHGNWNGGYKLHRGTNTTYKWIKISGKYVAEHRYVMEQYLGRKLTRQEAIHHIDGNGSNNSLNNLQVVSWAEHNKIHTGPYKYKSFICDCGETTPFAKNLCKRCYSREYAREKFGYIRKYI